MLCGLCRSRSLISHNNLLFEPRSNTLQFSGVAGAAPAGPGFVRARILDRAAHTLKMLVVGCTPSTAIPRISATIRRPAVIWSCAVRRSVARRDDGCWSGMANLLHAGALKAFSLVSVLSSSKRHWLRLFGCFRLATLIRALHGGTYLGRDRGVPQKDPMQSGTGVFWGRRGWYHSVSNTHHQP
jgi:hypothetical protein